MAKLTCRSNRRTSSTTTDDLLPNLAHPDAPTPAQVRLPYSCNRPSLPTRRQASSRVRSLARRRLTDEDRLPLRNLSTSRTATARSLPLSPSLSLPLLRRFPTATAVTSPTSLPITIPVLTPALCARTTSEAAVVRPRRRRPTGPKSTTTRRSRRVARPRPARAVFERAPLEAPTRLHAPRGPGPAVRRVSSGGREVEGGRGSTQASMEGQ